jgi:hypothetical protein
MAIRKSMEEILVVRGTREDWLTRVAKSLMAGGYKDVRTSEPLGQVTGKYRKFPTYGEITVTVCPAAATDMTQLTLRTTADVDNIYALFSSPNKKLMGVAKLGMA